MLGNAGNRARFASAFWWDKDSSLATYLGAAAGMEQLVEIEQPGTGKTEWRAARIVREELPPASHAEALERWRQAREVFRAALEECRQWLRGQQALAREEAWLDADLERRRDAVLVAAFALHRAYLDAAAGKLRSNLGALISVLAGKKPPSDETRALLPDLWASLFLVVPLVSITFASVERMFGIANAVAYGGLMVSAKKPAPSPIGEALGPSAWFDVRGEADEKWCRQEGEVVQGLLHRLVVAGVAPDLYLVTPFVVVAERLRELLRQDPLLVAWLGDARGWSREHVGTIHTVQGREAEAVILVLGAPAPWQRGARDWAGRRPNLMNVAVTRAKERLYVVGNRPLWRQAGLFGELDRRLPAQGADGPEPSVSSAAAISARPVWR